MMLYDVYHCDISAFEILPDGVPPPPLDPDFDAKLAAAMVVIAPGVSAKTAAELVGGSARQIEAGIVQDGVFCIGNLRESFEVRRASDEP